MVAGRQLSQFPESFGLIGRKLIEPLRALGIEPAPDTLLFDVASALSTQTLLLAAVAVVAALVLAHTPWGWEAYATCGNPRPAGYAGLQHARVRFVPLFYLALCEAR